MKVEKVQSSIAQALIKVELKPSQWPILLSDNGACYVSSELKDYLSTVNIKSIHGRVMHPQTQGKIERYHQSMKKSRCKLFIYNDLSYFSVTPSGFKPETF